MRPRWRQGRTVLPAEESDGGGNRDRRAEQQIRGREREWTPSPLNRVPLRDPRPLRSYRRAWWRHGYWYRQGDGVSVMGHSSTNLEYRAVAGIVWSACQFTFTCAGSDSEVSLRPAAPSRAGSLLEGVSHADFTTASSIDGMACEYESSVIGTMARLTPSLAI